MFLACRLIWRVLICSVLLIQAQYTRATEILFAGATSPLAEITKSALEDLIPNAFLPSLRQHRPALETAFNAIQITITGTQYPKASASIVDGKPVILVTEGITYVTALYAQYAVIRNRHFDQHNAKCSGYPAYMGDVLKKFSLTRQEALLKTMQMPMQYCGVPELANDTRFSEHVDDLFYKEGLFQSVLGLIVGHEYGHHLLGHLPVTAKEPMEFRRVEVEADYFGSNLLGSYASRLNAAALFDILSRARHTEAFAAERRHPAEECRSLYLFNLDNNYNNAVFNGASLGSRIELYEYMLKAVQQSLAPIGDRKCNNWHANEIENPSANLVPGETKCLVAQGKITIENIKQLKRIQFIGETTLPLADRRAKGCPLIRKLNKGLQESERVHLSCQTRYARFRRNQNDQNLMAETIRVYQAMESQCSE